MKIVIALYLMFVASLIFAGAGAVAGLILIALDIMNWAGFPYAIIASIIFGFMLCIILLFESPEKYNN